MKSQDQLKKLVEDSMAGINESRKALQELGDNPMPEDVAHVLAIEPWRDYNIYFGLERVMQGLYF